MKKFLALALILTLALSISVFGAQLTLNSDTGVESFDTTTNNSTTVNVTANVGTVLHRYAVDLEFTGLDVSVTGSTMTWDVNELEYVASGAVNPTNTEGTVTFSNRSDLPVYVSYVLTDTDNADLLTVSVDVDADAQEIEKATPKVGSTPGSPATLVYNLTVDAVDADDATDDAAEWALAAEYYAAWFNANGGSSRNIATITYTISMTNP